jgi:nitrogen fixation protein FixH
MDDTNHAREHTLLDGGAERRRGWNIWPIAIVIFFAVSIAGFVAFIVFCNMNPEELVRDDYYEQEIRHQAHMERIQRTASTAPQASVVYNKTNQTITVSLPSAHAAAGASGSIHFYRPSGARMDRQVPIQLSSGATQVIDGRNLQPGAWRVQVLWKFGEHDYYLEQKFIVGS